MTETALRRVVVVGAGLAGVSTCVELRRRGYDGGLVLVDNGPFPHDRPPLSKDYLAGIADDAKICLQPPGWFDEHQVDLRAGARAVALRPAARSVELADGREEHANAVVIATGGNSRPLPVPGGDTPAVHMLRTVDDARQLREVLRPGTRLVVIGAGLIGAEVASTARRLGVDVVLVDGDVDEHRRRADRCGDVERLGDHLRDVVTVADQEVVLGDRHRDAGDVGLLERVGADQCASDLSGDRDHRDGVHLGVGQRGDQVGGAGTRCGHQTPTLPVACA